jgi:hypothetical protein
MLLNQIVKLYPNDTKALVPQVHEQLRNVYFTATRDYPYFPIPFKETETASALKAIEGITAAALATLKDGATTHEPAVTVDLEKTTAFLFQTYLATVGGLGKLDPQVKSLLKSMTSSKSWVLVEITFIFQQIPTSSRRNRISTGECPPICSKRNAPASITISMALWRHLQLYE